MKHLFKIVNLQQSCRRIGVFLFMVTLLFLTIFIAVLPVIAQQTSSVAETVLRSPIIHGSNGLVMDNDDNLVIASIESKAVFVMDTKTGKVIKTYKHPLITGPDDVAVAKDGSIYYTDFYSGNIGKISPTGEISILVNLGQWVNSIRLNPDETKLYVGHCIGDDRLTEIDLKTNKPRLVAEKVGWPNSMYFGPDGKLYSPLNTTGEIIRWNLLTGEREVVFRVYTPPSSVKFDSQGRLLVTEFITGTVSRHDFKTGATKVIGKNLTIGLDNVAVDKKGRLFIASNHFGGIQELFEDGSVKELAPTGLLIPSGIAIVNSSAGEQLAVADIWNVKFFDPKTSKQTGVIPSGFYPWTNKAMKIDMPKEVTEPYRYLTDVELPITAWATPDGKTLVMSSWQSDAVQLYDLKERHITRIIDGNRPIYAMMFGNDVVVSELETHSVVAIAPDGKRQTLAKGLAFLGTGPPKASKAPAWLQRMILAIVSFFSDGMVYPSGLAAQGKNLFAADWYRGEIHQIVAEGEVMAKPKVVAKGLEQPEGIAFAKDGSLLAIESKIGRLVKINLVDGQKTILAESLQTGEKPGFNSVPSYLFSGVAVGADGSIYVSCDKTTEVVRVKP